MDNMKSLDPEIHRAIRKEIMRQESHLELIASENYTSPAILEATGSILTNKYAEGYPHHRYYGGCLHVDEIEEIACRRARKLFGAEHANVQPHAGSQANTAAYLAVLDPGDTILAMRLDQGGHLTHGHAKNISGAFYNIVSYGVDRETERIDMDEVGRLAQMHRPKLIIAGASAYPRLFDFDAFRAIADEVGALFMMDMAHIAGLVAAGAHPSPVGIAQIVTSTTHKTLRGPRSGFILCDEQFARRIDASVFPGTQGGPLMHVIAAKAICFAQAARKEFAQYGAEIVRNARALAEALTEEGFRLVSGGTDNHLMMVDLSSVNISGREAEHLLEAAHITVNKNLIPYDSRPPVETSGIRIGTAACTTRGMGVEEMKLIASWIGEVLRRRQDKFIRSVGEKVRALCERFPVYDRLASPCKELHASPLKEQDT